MHRSRRWAVLAASGLTVLVASTTWAGVPTDQVKASVDQVLKILRDPKLKSEAMQRERRLEIGQAADNIFDFRETAKRALGRHWRGVSKNDQLEFVPLFAELLQRAYLSKIERYRGEEISYVGESVDPGGEYAVVKTIFTTRKGVEVPIDYHLLRNDDRWLVYDVFVEGVSLVANYRAQFDQIIATSSYRELVRRMKAGNGIPAPGGATRQGRAPRS